MSNQVLPGSKDFSQRHIGPREDEQRAMLAKVGYSSLKDLLTAVVPESIRFKGEFELTPFNDPYSEPALLDTIKGLAELNQLNRSYIGLGYYGTYTPTVIARNILENPGWYTQYTPYQAEISQGRLEALLNFQTMVADLTGLPVANASLLDEGTAAAEAMALSRAVVARKRPNAKRFFVAEDTHPQTIGVVETRCEALGVEVEVGKAADFTPGENFFGVLVQYPTTYGAVVDYRELVEAAHAAGLLVTVATDLLALTLFTPPGEFGADIAVGNSQRLGVPLGYGGPHAAFFATRPDYQRLLPGRVVGVSKDSLGHPGYRLSLQTREQHIRRERATSNICTAQVLLAIMAAMYAVYHGPKRLREIAGRVRRLTAGLKTRLEAGNLAVIPDVFFDTLTVAPDETKYSNIKTRLEASGVNLRIIDDQAFGISLDETCDEGDVALLAGICVGSSEDTSVPLEDEPEIPEWARRKSAFLEHPVFNSYHSETEFLRYCRRLESKDLSLGTAMIPLGSCTMKLNATTEMVPVSWPEFSNLHPFVPVDQAQGYQQVFQDLSQALAVATGFSAVSLQPNAGSQGEFTGLLTIRAYHRSRGDEDRTVCLIPKSAHGTNPASAVMAGFEVVVVECDADGNIDLADLEEKAEKHRERLGALMVTYPSTHGVFEAEISRVCQILHERGGQVYLDGANLNALLGWVKPADFGADVCHINLHKTFAIPHGGGGPGMGPIAVKAHLAPFLPSHPIISCGGEKAIGPVAAAPWGSPSILPISYAYMALLGGDGLKRATEVAVLNANYLAKILDPHYPVLYKGQGGLVAHECILDLRDIKHSVGVEVEDVAKRLMDYGFHAPTVSWPVPGTLMIEPTESESKVELDRFCEAMIQIREEIRAVEDGKWTLAESPLRNAPHTAAMVTAAEWKMPYSREVAAFPSEYVKSFKFWPPVGRIDSAYGDRNLVCTCPEIESYSVYSNRQKYVAKST